MPEKTRMTPDWITRVWAENPCRRQPNGNILLGPVRAAFCNVLERPKPGQDGKEKAYGVVLLIPDLSLIGGQEALRPLYEARQSLVQEKAPNALQSEAVFRKLHNPFKSQGDFVNTKDPNGALYDGFVDGRLCISANSSQTKPPVVDQNLAPIIDKSGVYSGCWVIPALGPGWIGRDDNKGPTFYLQSLMVVAHDDNLGGVGAANPNADFAGVKVDASVNPAAMFGADGPTAGGQPAATPINLFA